MLTKTSFHENNMPLLSVLITTQPQEEHGSHLGGSSGLQWANRRPRVQASMGVGGSVRARRTENWEGLDGVWWAWTWPGSVCPGRLASAALYPGCWGQSLLRALGLWMDRQTGRPEA